MNINWRNLVIVVFGSFVIGGIFGNSYMNWILIIVWGIVSSTIWPIAPHQRKG